MKPQPPIPRIVAGYFLLDATILVAKLKHGPHEGCWEFPGGKQEAGETDAQTLRRVWREELGCNIEGGRLRGHYPHTDFTLALYYAHLDLPYMVPKARSAHVELRYLTLNELQTLTPLTPGTRMALGLP